LPINNLAGYKSVTTQLHSYTVVYQQLTLQCHRALQNQPLVGTSESASLRGVIHIKFLDPSKRLFGVFTPRSFNDHFGVTVM